MSGEDRQSDYVDPRLLLAAVPGWSGRQARIRMLAGGLNNRTFKVDFDGASYVLRAGAPSPQAGNRETALAVQRRAAEAGIAPRILYADAAGGVMLSEYLPGEPWTGALLRERARLRQLAALLRRLHALPTCGETFAPGRAAAHYFAALRDGDALLPFAERCLRLVESTPLSAQVCCCHNDVVAANLIGVVDPRLIDFEYARDNDPLFDLASVAGWHNLPDAHADYLLGAYQDGADSASRERLAAQRALFDALQWLWLASRQSVAPEAREARQMRRVEERLSDRPA